MHDLASEKTSPSPSPARTAWILLAAVGLEAVVTLAHFVYGAHLYDDPGRLHVVVPTLGFLALAAGLTALFVWRRSRLALLALAAIVAVPFLGIFGLYHGGYHHVLKDLLFLTGAAAETLARWFESPDYVLPDNLLFEATGILGLVAAGVVAQRLVRLVRVGWRRPAAGSRRDRAGTPAASSPGG